MREILIIVSQPHWDDEDWEYLMDELRSTLSNEVPAEGYTIQEFTK